MLVQRGLARICRITFLNGTNRVRHAGGVAIYVNSFINTKVICKSSNDCEIEYLFVELSTKEIKY